VKTLAQIDLGLTYGCRKGLTISVGLKNTELQLTATRDLNAPIRQGSLATKHNYTVVWR